MLAGMAKKFPPLVFPLDQNNQIYKEEKDLLFFPEKRP
jgi:hypothetical protein